MSILFKGNLEEGDYKLIKTTNGWVLAGEIAYVGIDRPQGKWKVSSKDSICSVCGKDEAEFICGTEDWYGYGLSNYCPNCGARMRGIDDERHNI